VEAVIVLRALVVSALLGGCACALGCGVECDAPSDCDIRDASCQRQVARALLCLRGGEAIDVPVHVVAADRYEREQLAMVEPSDADETRLFYRGLALLDLGSPQLDLAAATHLSLNNIAAFYDPDERAVTILDRGQPLDEVDYDGVLAHELVHAQQDREHGFAALFEHFGDTVDSDLALSAVTEGEAELYQGHFTANALGFAIGDVRWQHALESFRASSRRHAAASEDPLVELRPNFVYAFGASYVYDALAAAGRAGIAALYDEPPVSTRQVVAGFGAAPPGGTPWVEPGLLELAVPQLAAFPHLVATSRYGAYAFEVALAHWSGIRGFEPPPILSSDLAAQLRADELTVQSNDGHGDVLVSWRLRFVSAGDAQRAFDAVHGSRPMLRLAIDHRDLIVLATNGDALDGVDIETIEWLPVPAESESQAGTAASAIARKPVRCQLNPIWR
jgi:hypothetical protein